METLSPFLRIGIRHNNAKMEISLEAIISLLGLLLGGGGGAFFTWRFMRRKAKAEAETAEIDAAKELQDMYQQMLTDAKQDREDRKMQMGELRQERDQYKQERNELRGRFERLEESLRKMRCEYQTEKNETDRKIAQLGRKVEAMRPFLCGDLACKKRQLVALLGGEEDEKKTVTRKGKVESRTVRDLRMGKDPTNTPPPTPPRGGGESEDGGANDGLCGDVGGPFDIEPIDMKDM